MVANDEVVVNNVQLDVCEPRGELNIPHSNRLQELHGRSVVPKSLPRHAVEDSPNINPLLLLTRKNIVHPLGYVGERCNVAS